MPSLSPPHLVPIAHPYCRVASQVMQRILHIQFIQVYGAQSVRSHLVHIAHIDTGCQKSQAKPRQQAVQQMLNKTTTQLYGALSAHLAHIAHARAAKQAGSRPRSTCKIEQQFNRMKPSLPKPYLVHIAHAQAAKQPGSRPRSEVRTNVPKLKAAPDAQHQPPAKYRHWTMVNGKKRASMWWVCFKVSDFETQGCPCVQRVERLKGAAQGSTARQGQWADLKGSLDRYCGGALMRGLPS